MYMDVSELLRGVLSPAVTDNTTTTACAAAEAATTASAPYNGGSSSGGGGGGSGAPGLESLLALLGLRGVVPIWVFVSRSLGVEDPTNLLTALGLLWALQRLLQQLYRLANELVYEHFMSSVHVSSTDDIYTHLMKWLAAQPHMVDSRSLNAETVSRTAWEDAEGLDEADVARDRSGRYLNFSNQEAKTPPQFVPAVGTHNFWWKGQYFRLHRKREIIFNDNGGGGSMFDRKENLIISCLRRSPEPIKQLLHHVKEQHYIDHQARTVVKRPGPPHLRRFGGRYSWLQVANRPVRDMRTVVLDSRQKAEILADVNEYLHPVTPRWYANRGIPLRRGYLFHGPPGTGKTSLSFALAGVFGLDIHVISLQEPTLTEEDLGSLFGALPRRCVVLLEDIDSAGLRRPVDPALLEKDEGGEKTEEKKKTTKSGDEDKKSATKDSSSGGDSNNKGGDRPRRSDEWRISDLVKALRQDGKNNHNGNNNNDEKKGISLSGLLNAIDGVASHEGRVLIMTTNVPESLDEALIRPGRVDLQVEFANATRQQAEELFVRMYEADHHRDQRNQKKGQGYHATAASSSSATKNPATIKSDGGDDGGEEEVPAGSDSVEITQEKTNGDAVAAAKKRVELDIEEKELPAVAKKFAQKIPDGQFSPAEIQGYLLKRKKHPLRALEEADEWVEALMQQKASKSKIIKVQ